MENRLRAMGEKVLQTPVVNLKSMHERLVKSQKVHTFDIVGKSTLQSKPLAMNPTPITPPAKTPSTSEESFKKKIFRRKVLTNRYKRGKSFFIPPTSSSKEELEQGGKNASEMLSTLQARRVPLEL